MTERSSPPAFGEPEHATLYGVLKSVRLRKIAISSCEFFAGEALALYTVLAIKQVEMSLGEGAQKDRFVRATDHPRNDIQLNSQRCESCFLSDVRW